MLLACNDGTFDHHKKTKAMTALILPNTILSKRAIIFLIAILSLPICKSCAQRMKSKIIMSVLLEKTIVEKQAGGSVYLQRPSLWRIGGFYQSTIDNRVEGTVNSTFWGAIVAAPIVKSGKMNFFLTMRAGVANKIFYVVTPGILTEIKVTQRLSFDVGVSIRKGYQSALTSLNFRF
jgi:hypothetical protein